MAIEIPKELFVVKRGKERLAYITPHEDNAAGRKRKASALSWAHGYQSKGIKNEGEILPNDLQEGYEILLNVSRWSTDNVVWRILDPRGFEFEIYSGNMSEIIRHCSINKGIIEGKCVFGRENGKNYLIPETSEPYQKGVQFTKAKANAFGKPSDMKIGDIVTLSNGNGYTYLGKYFIMRYNSVEVGFDKCINFPVSESSYHFFKPNFKDENIYFQKTPKLLSIVKTDVPVKNPLAIINQAISTLNFNSIGQESSYDVVAAISSKKSEFSFDLTEVDISEVTSLPDQYNCKYSYRINDKYLLNQTNSYYGKNKGTFSVSNLEFKDNIIVLKNFQKKNEASSFYSYYGDYSIPNPIYLTEEITKVEQICFFIEEMHIPVKTSVH